MNIAVRSLCVVTGLLLSVAVASGQGQKRYQDEVFGSSEITTDILYGRVATQQLYLDVYAGKGDTVKNRPLVIFIHGGGFQMGFKGTGFAVMVCQALARRGYVAASIDYRLTPAPVGDTAFFEAMLRALHDAKAAVRFFRKNGSLYGVDTSKIFVTGSSAGAITALHLAYLDSAEVPAYVSWKRADTTFEGSSGNPGFSSRVQGVISNWGAIGDTAWIKRGAVPVYCVHGTADSLIYYNLVPAYGPFAYSSKYIVLTAQQKGIPTGLRLFIGAGHELNGDTTRQDSAIKDFSAWLYTILNRKTVSVRENPRPVAAAFALEQNYPNPFNPATIIRYRLSDRSRVTLSVFNTLGQRIATLVNADVEAGYHEARFDAGSLASGVYLYRLTASAPGKSTFSQTRRLLLLR